MNNRDNYTHSWMVSLNRRDLAHLLEISEIDITHIELDTPCDQDAEDDVFHARGAASQSGLANLAGNPAVYVFHMREITA